MSELVKYEAARRAISEAVAVDEVKSIMDKAESMRQYARLSKDFELANKAAEIRIRAERRMGEMLKEQRESGQMNKGGWTEKNLESQGGTSSPKLSEIGISKNMSSRAQAVAAVPVEEFEEEIRETQKQGKELTSAMVRNIGKRKKKKDKEKEIAEISEGNEELGTERTYPVIYADPPWRYEFSKSDSRQIENQYPTMTLDEICAIEIPVSDDAILFLWTTSPKLEDSFKVVNAWGFEYKTCAIWDKQKIGMGYYFRQQHEILLVCKKGDIPAPDPANRPGSVFSFEREEHSAKPHQVAGMIEAMYPEFSKLEMFCRSPRDGWDVWGNQSGA